MAAIESLITIQVTPNEVVALNYILQHFLKMSQPGDEAQAQIMALIAQFDERLRSGGVRWLPPLPPNFDGRERPQ